eukprot:CAMPEP_0170085270 /NCGR_PEP_ID=MMETSP0019_2-20121128/20195_1 /TAXON_ID=98059 /ORGANISM="Dinobryon sp., Strain UTEXLB2267" /LENGTH=77 /DNA_ID=CAMNT_0010301647 /DNA_START=923 /DNA_END=1153 /DNA_ORIENTATION=+
MKDRDTHTKEENCWSLAKVGGAVSELIPGTISGEYGHQNDAHNTEKLHQSPTPSLLQRTKENNTKLDNPVGFHSLGW